MEEAGFRRKAAFFLLKFFVIYGVLQALLLAAPLASLEQWIAAVEAGLLGLESNGSTIVFGGQAFEIVANCTGLMSASVLAAIVFSLRKPELGKKLGLVVAGSAALFLLNLARVYAVLLAAISLGAGWGEGLHIATWFLMAGAVLVLWYKLSERAVGKKGLAGML